MQESKQQQITKVTKQQFPQGIEAMGTDALRMTYLALATTGRDIRFDISRLQGYRNFCNKIWNAARFVLDFALKDVDPKQVITPPTTSHPIHDWMLSKLQKMTEQAHHYFKSYRFDLLAQGLYDLVWHQYCDWYLEFNKQFLFFTDERKDMARYYLLSILEQLLKLLHPLIPFITETIWQEIAPRLGCEVQLLCTRFILRQMQNLSIIKRKKKCWYCNKSLRRFVACAIVWIFQEIFLCVLK